MTAYLVERNLASLTERHLSAIQHALQEACHRLTRHGSHVRYLSSTFVPARSRCYCRFEATSADIVKAVNETAFIPYLSINEAIDLAVTRRAVSKEKEV